MELSLSHTLHLFNIFREYDEKENCAQLLEEECIKMFGTRLYDEHDCNVVSMNSLNIHDANDMQSHKLVYAMFDEDDMFSPPSFDEQIYYDESMPPIYDDYIDESGFGEVMTLFSDESTISEEVPIDYENKVAIYDDYCDDMYAIKSSDDYICKTCHDYDYPFSEHYSFNVETIYSIRVSYDTPIILNEKSFAYVESNKNSMLVDHEKNALRDGYIVESIHDATENYYEGGIYACRNCNNIKFPLYVLKV